MTEMSLSQTLLHWVRGVRLSDLPPSVRAQVVATMRDKLSGAQTLTAMAIGIEIICRLGLVAQKGVLAGGFHPTSILGTMVDAWPPDGPRRRGCARRCWRALAAMARVRSLRARMPCIDPSHHR